LSLGVIDLEVPEFVDLTDTKKKRDIARRMVVNKKKEGKEQGIWVNKKEISRVLSEVSRERGGEGGEGDGQRQEEG